MAFHHRYSTIDCIVRNSSPLGVKIELDAIEALPAEVDLTIPGKGISFVGKIIWQTHREAGLALRPTKITHADMPLDTVLRLRATERAIRALRHRLDQFSNEV